MSKIEIETTESIANGEEGKTETGSRAAERLRPEGVLDTARVAAESVKNWARETASKLSASLNTTQARENLNRLLDTANDQIESAVNALGDKIGRIADAPFSKDLSRVPEAERERILRGVESDIRIGIRMGHESDVTDSFDFGGARYRIDPEVQERLRTQVRARETLYEASLQEQNQLRAKREENERVKEKERKAKWERFQDNQRELSRRIARENAEKAEFERKSYDAYKAAHFDEALEAQKEWYRREAELNKSGRKTTYEENAEMVRLALKAQGIDNSRPPIPGLAGEPTDEEINRIRFTQRSSPGNHHFRRLREHWNKRNLSHDVHERLKADKDPSYLEWIKSNQN